MDSTEIMSALLPNLWVFIAHIVASLTLLALTICLVWRPTKNALEKRRNYIANEIREAEEARKEVFIKLQEAEKEKIEAHNRANIIVSDATNQAYKRKEEIEYEANLNARKIRTDAETEAEKLKIKIKNESQKQIVNIAFSAAETLVKKKYNYADDSRTINEFIKQLEKGEKDE
jgi:F-type H+-transporting ATPase subunit b